VHGEIRVGTEETEDGQVEVDGRKLHAKTETRAPAPGR
jgi:hypothetical protein